MKAAVVTAFDTDIHPARGDRPVKPTPPFVPGHEGVGVVERIGGRVVFEP